MIPVDDLLRRASALLLDEGFVRWTESELLDWLHDALAAIVVRRPSSLADIETLTLVEGAVQDLGLSGVMDVIRVLPSGRPLSRASRAHLDAADPDWYARAVTERIVNYAIDDRAEGIFYVYPPAADGTQVEALVWRVPDTKPAKGGQVDIGREYLNPLLNYIAFRAFSKDSEYANGQIAASYYQLFEADLGIQNQTAARTGPSQGET